MNRSLGILTKGHGIYNRKGICSRCLRTGHKESLLRVMTWDGHTFTIWCNWCASDVHWCASQKLSSWSSLVMTFIKEKAYVHDVFEQVIRMTEFLLPYRNVHDIYENVTNMLGISMPGILRECTYIFSNLIVLMLETKSTSLWNVWYTLLHLIFIQCFGLDPDNSLDVVNLWVWSMGDSFLIHGRFFLWSIGDFFLIHWEISFLIHWEFFSDPWEISFWSMGDFLSVILDQTAWDSYGVGTTRGQDCRQPQT